ncbi:MAG: hypothetical protein GY771_03875 [bacterium]|nr:hypothetical protein [bacterium]
MRYIYTLCMVLCSINVVHCGAIDVINADVSSGPFQFTEYDDKSNDLNVLYFSYFAFYHWDLNYTDIEPTDMENYLDQATVESRWRLFDNAVLNIITAPSFDPASESGIDYFYVLRYENEKRDRDYTDKARITYLDIGGPFIDGPNGGYWDFQYDIHMAVAVARIHKHLYNNNRRLKWDVLYEMLMFYLYETRYEDLRYLYDSNFHILDPQCLPRKLTANLSEEEKEILDNTLSRSYIVSNRHCEQKKYYGFSTWSEYGGELIYWEIRAGMGQLGKNYEIIGKMGDYKELDIKIFYPPNVELNPEVKMAYEEAIRDGIPLE